MNTKQAITNPYVPPTRPVLLAGRNGLPKLVMTAANGACAEVYLQGARLTSWIPAGGSEWLFLCDDGACNSNRIHGGMSLIFPQPGADSLVDTLEWSLARVGQTENTVSARFQLTDSRATRRVWRHRFLLELDVTVGDTRLEVGWRIKNAGQKPLRFRAALQQHLCLTEGLIKARLLGLEGRRYRDLLKGEEGSGDTSLLEAASGCNRHYPNAAVPLLQLRDGTRTLRITQQGLPDIGLWNPGPIVTTALADPHTHERSAFLRIEAATGEQPIKLQPGECWHGTQMFTADEAPLLSTA